MPFKRGGPNPVQKLTDAQAAEILRRRRDGERGKDLAKEFGVSDSLVSLLKKGKRRNLTLDGG